MKTGRLNYMQTQKFNQVDVTCTNTGKIAIADVLQKNDKILKVALVGTNIVIMLKREDTRKLYIGNFKNLEFTSTGQSI